MDNLTFYSTNSFTTDSKGNGHGSGVIKSPGAAFVLTDSYSGEKTAYKFVHDGIGGYSFRNVPADTIESEDSGWYKDGNSMNLTRGQWEDFERAMRDPSYAGIVGKFTDSITAVTPLYGNVDANSTIKGVAIGVQLFTLSKIWYPIPGPNEQVQIQYKNKHYVNA